MLRNYDVILFFYKFEDLFELLYYVLFLYLDCDNVMCDVVFYFLYVNFLFFVLYIFYSFYFV